MDMRLLAVLLLAVPLLAGPVEVKFALSGYFVQRRPSKPIDARVPRNQLSLVALPDVRVPYGRFDGFRVVLANDTRAAVTLTAQDMRLDIIREARDTAGRWRPVEHLPPSWCGNSYHPVTLSPGRAWSFAAPEYAGPFRTTMRFVLLRAQGNVYSNEFAGSIHPEQFERKEGDAPSKIMDPYTE